MNKFYKTDNNLESIDKEMIVEPIYIKMLNNLLGSGIRDNATFISSKHSNIDLKKILSKTDYEKIFSNESFKVEVSKNNSKKQFQDLHKSKTFNSFSHAIDDNDIYLSIKDRETLKKDFGKNKKAILNKIEKNQNLVSKWKKIKNKYLDMQDQTSIWPLYIGSMIIKIKTKRNVIYAPLILKKVEIKISSTNKIYIKSIDTDINVNEKLLLLLKDKYKFNLPGMHPEEDFCIEEAIDAFTHSFSSLIPADYDFKDNFVFQSKDAVTNTTLEYAPGAILTLTVPISNHLISKFIEILRNGDIERLLEIDPLIKIDDEISKNMKEQKQIYRITRTDLSQERAIIGSLLDSSIIWGPPGTGKSQTISNIIANLMANKNSIIMTSEKKAALDVIKDRMGKLSKYIFFGLIDKNISKKEFYKPFQDLIRKISDFNKVERKPGSPSINEYQIEYYKQTLKLAKENIAAISRIQKEKQINNEAIEFLLKNESLIKKSTNIKDLIKSNSLEKLIEKNNIKKSGLFSKRTFPLDIQIMEKYLKELKGNLFVLDSFLKIKDKKLIEKTRDLCAIENNYRFDKNKLDDDNEYLDNLFAERFSKKIEKMKKNEKFGKRIDTFMKNCNSAFRVPYKFINIYKDIIKELFNVFVSTPQYLAGIIDMDRKYDYSIFDEASQLHIEKAIPFMSISKKSIIAGDDKQMKPTNYFGSRDNSTVSDNPNKNNLDSLLEYAESMGLKAREYMLSKNYRSSASELMLFNSKVFYESNLDVVDNIEYATNPVQCIEVGGKWEGGVNEKEGKALLDYNLKILEEWKTIILLTLNSTQMKYIESLAYRDSKYDKIVNALETGQVKIRNLENIQGDESDLILISVAYDKNARLGLTYVAKAEGKNALNVATSRAKDKMVVFKSISSKEIEASETNESINIFKKWLEYLEKSSEERKALYSKENVDDSDDQKLKKFNSVFEEEVFNYLKQELKQDVLVKTKYLVGSYIINIALCDKQTEKIIMGIEAIEYKHSKRKWLELSDKKNYVNLLLNPYKYNEGFKQMTKDIERQRFLEAKQYKVYRITELNWKINKKNDLNKIKKIIGL